MTDEQDYEGYEPDVPEAEEEGTPVPRGAQMRKGILQRNRPQVSRPRSISKSGSRILTQEKRRQALEFRKAGVPYHEIATRLGYYDASAARKAVMAAFGDVIQEPVQELKTLQVERLNHMLLMLWGKVQNGDERAIETTLRIMDKIDKLNGTEAASQVDVNVTNNSAVLVVDGNKEDFIRAMKQMAGVAPDGTNIPPAIGPAQGIAAPPTGLDDVLDGEVLGDTPEGGPLFEETPYVPYSVASDDEAGGEDTPPAYNWEV